MIKVKWKKNKSTGRWECLARRELGCRVFTCICLVQDPEDLVACASVERTAVADVQRQLNDAGVI